MSYAQSYDDIANHKQTDKKMNELESLKNIFKDRIFKIPDYQRGYAWTERQLKDFWEDVVNLPADRFHYTGLLSLKKVDRIVWNNWNDERWLLEDRGYKPFHVVDGQQQLPDGPQVARCVCESHGSYDRGVRASLHAEDPQIKGRRGG